MTNTKFDKLLGLLEPLENDGVGEWIIDKEHKERKTILYTFHIQSIQKWLMS